MLKNIYSFSNWKNKLKTNFKVKKIKNIFSLYRKKKIFYQGFDVEFKDKDKNIYKRFLL